MQNSALHMDGVDDSIDDIDADVNTLVVSFEEILVIL